MYLVKEARARWRAPSRGVTVDRDAVTLRDDNGTEMRLALISWFVAEAIVHGPHRLAELELAIGRLDLQPHSPRGLNGRTV